MGNSILFIPRLILKDIDIVGVYDLLRNARTVKVKDNYMYVADAGWGTKIFDISDTSNPIFKVTINVSSNDIFISGNTLFICGSVGFKIYNITNPLITSLIGGCSLATTNPQDVVVKGNYAFVADYTAGCQIIDITTPSSPAIIYTYNSGSAYCYSVYAVGNLLYVGENAAIKILNITVPLSPSLSGSISLSGACYGIKVVGDYLYSSHYTTVNGFKIIDISNPASPLLVSQYDFTSSYAMAVDVYGNYAYVITYRSTGAPDTGVYILNISNPANITFVKFKFFEKWGTSVFYDINSGLIFLVVNPSAYILNPNF